jgi:hypothetical protein
VHKSLTMDHCLRSTQNLLLELSGEPLLLALPGKLDGLSVLDLVNSEADIPVSL